MPSLAYLIHGRLPGRSAAACEGGHAAQTCWFDIISNVSSAAPAAPIWSAIICVE